MSCQCQMERTPAFGTVVAVVTVQSQYTSCHTRLFEVTRNHCLTYRLRRPHALQGWFYRSSFSLIYNIMSFQLYNYVGALTELVHASCRWVKAQVEARTFLNFSAALSTLVKILTKSNKGNHTTTLVIWFDVELCIDVIHQWFIK